MKIYQLIYASTATVKLKFGELKELAENASENNGKDLITGLLVYGNGYFMQVLEGTQHSVNNLYLKISHDKRHSDLRILDYNMVSSKSFSQWGMGSVDVNFNPEFVEVTKQVFQNSQFKPYDLRPREANDLMNEYARVFNG
jgi:hypothetical protein